jgi:ankyrin repeat protein
VLARDRLSNTALIHAAGAGHGDIVRLLLDRGADIDHANLRGSTALAAAVARNRTDVTLLGAAAFNTEAEVVRRLLADGADPAEMDGTGKGPIVYAAGKGLVSIVQLLLDAGLDVNAAYGHDLTALMWAAGHANIVPVQDGLATVKLLVERGADLNLVDDRGRTALMIAAGRGHAQIAAWLVENGADPRVKDRGGKTARDLAASPAVADALASAGDHSPAR